MTRSSLRQPPVTAIGAADMGGLNQVGEEIEHRQVADLDAMGLPPPFCAVLLYASGQRLRADRGLQGGPDTEAQITIAAKKLQKKLFTQKMFWRN